MNIKIKVTNALTGQVEIDSQLTVYSDYATVQANHQAFVEMFPDCHVNFFMDDNSFICGVPHNMKQDEIAYDEGRMSWNDYVAKWYNGCPSLCNEDDDIVILERYEAEDFASRDSVCY